MRVKIPTEYLPDIDNTLTQSGAPADAAATGTAVNDAVYMAQQAAHMGLVANGKAATASFYENINKSADEAVGGFFVKISDKVPTMSDLKNGYSITGVESVNEEGEVPSGVIGGAFEIPPFAMAEEFFIAMTVEVDGAIVMMDGSAVIIPSDGYTAENITFPTKGVWAPFFITSFYINGYDFNAPSWDELENKPFGTVSAHYGDTVADGDTIRGTGRLDGRTTAAASGSALTFMCVSPDTPSMDDLANGCTFLLSGGGNTTQIPLDADYFSMSDTGVIGNADSVIYIATQDGGTFATDDGELSLPRKGVYIYATINGTPFIDTWAITIPGYTFTPDVVTPLEEKYLPESVESVVIRSSTEGSTKKFRLTIDDSGTIAATEVA